MSVSAASKALDAGQTIGLTASVLNDRTGAGVSWGLTGPGSLLGPGGLTLKYQAPARGTTGIQQATITVTSVADRTKSASVQITINPYPTMPFQSLADGTVGVPYSEPVQLTGGTTPFQWSVYNGPISTGWRVGGAVPDGLTLDASTGMISGTPTAAGTWYFDATATDASGVQADNGFLSIQIHPAPSGAANPVPFVDQSLGPTAVAPGASSFTLNVSGAGFVSGATVNWDGTPLTTTFVDSEHLSALVPSANVATAQTASVTVVNPLPGGGSSNVVYFQVGLPESAIQFADAPNSPLSSMYPEGLAVADFNQDGKPDLAVGSYVRLYVMTGKGDGTFDPASGSPIPVPSPPYDNFATPLTGGLTVGDFNHSGHLGIAITELENEAAVILLGAGDGTFATSSAAFADSKGSGTIALGSADFNGDGNLDLAIINQFNGFSPLALGYGKGAFNTAGHLYTNCWSGGCGFPAGEATGDFNRDGKLDVAIAGGGSSTYPFSGIAISLGNGDGTFTQASSSPISLGQDLTAIVAADFNGDGKLDLAATDYVGNNVLILQGNGDGTFQAPITFSVGNGPSAIATGDFNNDGKLDLAVTNSGDNSVALLSGNGDGTFSPASGSPYAVGKGPFGIAAADFNGDGKLDVAVVNLFGGTVSILLQQ